jgi:hypothetical protein
VQTTDRQEGPLPQSLHPFRRSRNAPGPDPVGFDCLIAQVMFPESPFGRYGVDMQMPPTSGTISQRLV